MDKSTLQIVLEAKDNATKSLEKLGKELDKLSGGTSNASSATGSLTGSVFKGVLAYDLFRKAVSMAYGQIRQGVGEALAEQQMLAQTKAILASTGQSWDKVGDQVLEFGNKMLKMGIDNETAQLSVAKFARILKGDVSRGMDTVKLAADLTASGFGDFQSNVDNLSRILIGRGQRALIQYGIALKEGATITEQLAAVQGKAVISAEQFASSTKGSLQVIKTAISEVRSSIAQGLLLAFSEAIKKSGQFAGDMDSNAKLMDKFGKSAFIAGQSILLVINLIKSAWAGLSGIIKSIAGVILEGVKVVANVMLGLAMIGEKLNVVNESTVAGLEAFRDELGKQADSLATSAIDNSIKSTTELFGAIKNLGKGYEELKAKQDIADKALGNLNANLGEAGEIVAGAEKDFNNFRDEIGKTLAELSFEHDDKIKNIKEKLASLSEEYFKTSNEGAKSIRDLERSNKESLKSIDKDISSAVARMAELRNEFEKQKGVDKQALAEQFINAEKAVAKLRDELVRATDAQQIVDIKGQIQAQEQAIKKTSDVQKDFTKEIADARRHAGLSELERAIEDFNIKRSLAEQELASNLAQIQTEILVLEEKRAIEKQLNIEKMAETQAEIAEKLANIQKEKIAKQEEMKAEIDLQTAKTILIMQLIIGAQNYRDKVMADSHEKTKEMIEQEIELYKKLEQQIKQAASARSSGLISTKPILGSRETGGPISKTGLYMMHEGEYVLNKNQAQGGGKSVVVNINGGNYLSQDAAEMMGDLIISKLKTNMRI